MCDAKMTEEVLLSNSTQRGPNRAMQPRCAMRFESHTPKTLAMRKSCFASDAKTHWFDLKSQENARKTFCENPAMLACDAKNRHVFLRSSDAKSLRFGLPLRFGLRCECPRCQITSDVDRSMRATKNSTPRGTKTDGFQHGKVWRLSKLAL